MPHGRGVSFGLSVDSIQLVSRLQSMDDDLTAAEAREIAELEAEARECGADPIEYALIVCAMADES